MTYLYSAKACRLSTGSWLWKHVLIYDVRKVTARVESQSLFCMNVEPITITGTHNWQLRSLTKTHIIIVAWGTTESSNTWCPRDSKMNSSNEIVDESVDIWGAVKREIWRGRNCAHVHAVELFTYLPIMLCWFWCCFFSWFRDCDRFLWQTITIMEWYW